MSPPKPDLPPDRVTRVVWNWRAEASPIASRPDGARTKALIHLLVALSVASLLWVFAGARLLPRLILALGLAFSSLGLAAPRLFDRVEAMLRTFGRWVGAGVTWVLLGLFFMLVFVPMRWVIGLRRRDPLGLRFPGPPGTYWIPCRRRARRDSYSMQY